jgi:hypothetical protein
LVDPSFGIIRWFIDYGCRVEERELLYRCENRIYRTMCFQKKDDNDSYHQQKNTGIGDLLIIETLEFYNLSFSSSIYYHSKSIKQQRETFNRSQKSRPPTLSSEDFSSSLDHLLGASTLLAIIFDLLMYAYAIPTTSNTKELFLPVFADTKILKIRYPLPPQSLQLCFSRPCSQVLKVMILLHTCYLCNFCKCIYSFRARRYYFIREIKIPASSASLYAKMLEFPMLVHRAHNQ